MYFDRKTSVAKTICPDLKIVLDLIVRMVYFGKPKPHKSTILKITVKNEFILCNIYLTHGSLVPVSKLCCIRNQFIKVSHVTKKINIKKKT